MRSDEGTDEQGDERLVDDRDARDPAEDLPGRDDEARLDPNDAPTIGAVPTITGLFDMPHVDDDPSDDDAEAEDFVDSSQPQTDSVRIIAEMFRGFRRRSATPEQDLQQILGTATQTLPIVSDGQLVRAEPAPTAGAIPIVRTPGDEPDADADSADDVDGTAVGPSTEDIAIDEPASAAAVETASDAGADMADETDADADSADADDASSDEALVGDEANASDPADPGDALPETVAIAIAPVAHAAAPDALTRAPAEGEGADATAEETDVSTPDDQRTITTAYVPHDDGNQTEQALAWLTAENVGTGQTPIVSGAAELVPRRRRWLAAIFAPIVTAIVLAVAYVVAFSVWPLDNVSPSIAAAEVDTPVAPAASIPWPENGQAAVLVDGTDDVLTSATEESPETIGPMASLTKVITVMTLLERQPLALGEQGPEYEFGYLDQQQADVLRWSNESALDVPIGGTLTYHQLLEGILMGSAGNYANKLVDALWEGDRDAYLTDALSWLQDNGIDDTLVVDATGIGPDNQSTPTEMAKVSQIALQHPVVAEIVAQGSVELPGAGLVENSNPLLGEDGIVGIKTGHLDEVSIVSYNLTTAKDIDTGADEPLRAYAAVMGQLDADAQEQVSRDLLDAVTAGLQPVDAMAEGTVVATVTTPWGARVDIVSDDTASLTLWNGETAEIDVDYDIALGDTEGDEVGTATITGALDSDEITLVATGDLPRPSLEWRLTHPLELLGIAE
ncbi:D-alanyl-D-alanine carboxypeptidase family protein [Microbacterium karelineae]|uniref:D-alanyl-D-alanine carboxypeptidase family protein n=1 Tax=Microbacterium karelineae TaxID=2654283 RepID=UPI0012E9D588|nr:hypothetical protein [Microbacterium karelineae]